MLGTDSDRKIKIGIVGNEVLGHAMFIVDGRWGHGPLRRAMHEAMMSVLESSS